MDIDKVIQTLSEAIEVQQSLSKTRIKRLNKPKWR